MEKYVQKKNFDATQVDDEWIILNTDNFTVTTLNQVAGFCFQLLKRPLNIDSIIQEVEKNYQVPDGPIKEDIEFLLSQLMDYDLIKHAS